MRSLTFKGFITRYIKEVSNNNTISVSKLVQEASTTNPKIIEPMLLYVAIKNKSKLFFASTQNSQINKKHLEIFEKHLIDISEKDLPKVLTVLPAGYMNIYKKYLEAKNKNIANDPAKEHYKDEILKIAKRYNLTISAIAKETGLKRGNSYRFFSKDQDDYLSLALLKKAYKTLHKKYCLEEGDGAYQHRKNA